jgi:MFS family permease
MTSPNIDTASDSRPAVTEREYYPFRWYILATMAVVVAVQGMALIAPAPLIGVIMQSLPQLSAGEVTWMTMGSWNLAVAVSAIGSGFILDRVGFTRLYVAGLIIILAIWLLMPLFGLSFWGMTTLRLIQAFGAGPIMAAGVYVASICFPKNERNLVTGAFGASMFIGIALALQIVPNSLSATVTWTDALRNLWPFAIVAIAMAIGAYFGLKRLGISETAIATASGTHAEHSQTLFLQALRTPVTWVAIGAVILGSWFDQAYSDMVPGFMALPIGLGLGAATAGTMSSIATFGQIIGAILVGFIVERALKGRGRVTAIAGFGIGALCSLLLLTQLAHSSVLIWILLALTFFKSWINPSALGFVAKNYEPAVAGKLGGFAMGIGIFGGLAGVSVGSAALHFTGDYTMSTIIMAAVATIGALLCVFLIPNKKMVASSEE